MLSILIPVYNYDITELVTKLTLQCVKTKIPFEIICVDDGSHCKQPSISEDYLTWYANPKNEGRAKTRNTLASMAKYKNLLFLDADVLPSNENFISNYLTQVDSKVVCGGISYQNEKPEKQRLLRWNYGKKYEERNARSRNHNPYLSFMTGNFLCHKSVFERVTFISSLTTYGHEDTLFGKELLENGIDIVHIDNDAIHLGLESNKEFLSKSKVGIKSLALLYKDKKITRHYSKLIKFYEKLEWLGLKNVVIKLLYSQASKIEKKLVINGSFSWKLQLLKLLWFSEEIKL